MTRWGEPKQESWAMTLVQYVAYIAVAIGFVIAITAR
jgi:hypothetical protein